MTLKKNLDISKNSDNSYIEGSSYLYDNELNEINESKEWYLYSWNEKSVFFIKFFLKFILFIILLYLFLLSLNFMTIGFTLVSSYAIKAGDVIKFIFKNPFAALAIGIIATAIMQNATATTSIAVSMVGAGIIPSVKNAIPIIMGSNIGTCFSNSLIALTLNRNSAEFKRAFSAATLNDIFNFLTTIILLPAEIFTNFLYKISKNLTDLIPFENAEEVAKANFISYILQPMTDLFIQLNSTAVNEISNGNKDVNQVSLRCCGYRSFNISLNNSELFLNGSNLIDFVYENRTQCIECQYLSMSMLRAFGEGGTGLFCVILSLVILIASSFGIVKVLSLLIVGPIAKGVRKAVNASFPGKFKFLTEILLFIISFLLTLIVQSSNIITATLVPLCGIGIITLQRVYVMTLGSNIGTTVTGILSAFTQPPASIKKSMQIAFVYTLFNFIGVLLWLPIPFMRLPKKFARKLGSVVLKYKWFVYVYVSWVYFILPLIVFGLALIPYWIGLALFGIPLIIVFVSYISIRLINIVFNDILPDKLKNFDWLPIWLRSLKPYDEIMKKIQLAITKLFFKQNKSEYFAIDDSLDSNQQHNKEMMKNLRKMSVIISLIKEAQVYKDKYGINNDSSDEEEDFQKLPTNAYKKMNSCDF